MSPECTPLMYVSDRDAAWHLAKQLCQVFPGQSEEAQRTTERFIKVLMEIFGHDKFGELLLCAKQVDVLYEEAAE